MRSRVAERRVRGLLHDVAELSGQRQCAASLHCCGFDEENVAAHGCPCQTGGDTDLIPLQQLFLNNLRTSEELIDVVGMNLADLLFTSRNLFRGFAANGGNLSLEISKAGFLRVLI